MVHTCQVAGAAFLSYATLAMLSADSEQTNCGFVSAFRKPCPKNQRQTRASQRAAEWIASE
eukprot:3178088-Rhodomonas_salina.1